MMSAIQHVRPGDIGYGYVGAWEPFLSARASQGEPRCFYRDPAL
jgi:hypothetical protein